MISDDDDAESSIESSSILDTQLIIHDPIHGSFSLPRIAWIIIDTPEFQRLRYIKQTGNTCFVYPGAEHTRFQHCLGVAHLALEFGCAIKLKSAEMITDQQILLLCIAGLCHDLGHCAFSHLYDACIIPMFQALVIDRPGLVSIATHEEASYLILSRIWEREREIRDVLSKADIHTIGSPDKLPKRLETELRWTDYDYKHGYLYEVVSNYRTGIDVDKFDYLKRDSHYTGIPCNFDPQRLMTFLSLKRMRNGQYIVEYLCKSNELINSMWLSRDDLHRRAYQHRVVKCIDLMTIEMIRLCADTPVPGSNPPVLLRHAHHDLDSYLLLTDTTIVSIAESVPAAKVILDSIRKRDLWNTVATVISHTPLNIEFTETKADVRINHAEFRGEYVYYIYHVGREPIDAIFFVELITQAKGGEIHLRLKDQSSWLQELRK
jgi:HD superfamily phosphohydrolase